MPYDHFISYSRRGNQQDRITQIVGRILTDFAAFAGSQGWAHRLRNSPVFPCHSGMKMPIVSSWIRKH